MHVQPLCPDGRRDDGHAVRHRRDQLALRPRADAQRALGLPVLLAVAQRDEPLLKYAGHAGGGGGLGLVLVILLVLYLLGYL